MSNTAHCASCGERKRLNYQDVSCSQKCAALAFVCYHDVGPLEFVYCSECGAITTRCTCDVPGGEPEESVDHD